MTQTANNLLTERENIQPRSCCTDRAIARSIQQDLGWIFSRTARTVEVSKFLLYGIVRLQKGRCENPECRKITEYGGISRNMPELISEYGGISRNITGYHEISRHFPGIYRNITIFSDGSHATVYKHGRLTTYFITKVMDLSHFDGK